MGKKPAKNKMDDRPSAAVRIRVYKRDRFQCTYCGAPGTDAELEVDHIIPLAKGGSNHMSNLTTACRKCNARKGTRDAPPIGRAKSRSPEPDGSLVGRCLHTLNEKGDVHYQGQIIDDIGDRVFVQLFSFMDGEPTNCIALEKSFVFDEKKCALYRNCDQMNARFRVLQRATFRREGWEFFEHDDDFEDFMFRRGEYAPKEV